MKNWIPKISAVLLVVIFTYTGLLVFGTIQSHKTNSHEDLDITHITFYGRYSIDGGEYKTLSDKTDIDINKGQKILLEGHFDRMIENEQLLFTLKNLQFTMKVNGVQAAEYGQPGTYPNFMHSAGFTRHMVSVKRIAPDDYVEIELIYPYHRGGRTAFYEFMNNMSIGSKGSFYSKLYTDHGLSILLVTVIIIMGVCAFAASILLKLWKHKNGQRVMTFSAFVITGGVWFLMDTFYLCSDIVMPYPRYFNIVDMINLLLLPLSGVYFLSSFLESKKLQKIASIIQLTQLICISAIILLQFFGIRDIYENQVYSIPLNSGAALIIFIIACYEVIKKKNKQIKSAVIAMTPTAIALYSDIVIHFANPRKYQYLFRIGFFLSCCVHLITSIKLFKRNVRAKEREQKLKEEMADLKISIMLSQIQPHFLYNALNAIEEICMEDAEKASRAIEHFAKYLRGNMDSLTQKELIPFSKELNHLENYLYIEFLRFGDRMNVEYELAVTDFMIPSLILQPIVENAIRYGITKKLGGGTVKIKTRETDSSILIEIADDGIGFDSQQGSDQRSHIGIQNVKSRLKRQCNGTMYIMSTKDVGTTITMNIPKEGVMLL